MDNRVVRSLLRSLDESWAVACNNPRPGGEGRPGLVAEAGAGVLVGFEVAGLAPMVYRDGRVGDVIREIQGIVAETGSKEYTGGHYDRIVLVIAAGGPASSRREVRSILYAHTFEQAGGIDEAYLLFDTGPDTGTCPYLKLNLRTG